MFVAVKAKNNGLKVLICHHSILPVFIRQMVYFKVLHLLPLLL